MPNRSVSKITLIKRIREGSVRGATYNVTEGVYLDSSGVQVVSTGLMQAKNIAEYLLDDLMWDVSEVMDAPRERRFYGYVEGVLVVTADTRRPIHDYFDVNVPNHTPAMVFDTMTGDVVWESKP